MKLLYQRDHGFSFQKNKSKLDFPPHIHNAVEIFFFLQGSSRVLCGKEKTDLEAGDVFIAFPNQIHGYENSRDIRGYLLILPVRPYLSAYYSTLMRKRPECPCLKKGQWEHTGLLQLLELAYGDMKQASQDVMQGYLQVIVGKLLPLLDLQEIRSGSEEVLTEVLLYVNDHYTEPLSRERIAKAVGYNESYVSHVFSEMMGTTLPEYINSLRVFDASGLLCESQRSVTDIGLSVGFGSARNFNRAFRQEMGMTPREYRAAMKEGKKALIEG